MSFDPNFPSDDSEMKALEYRASFLGGVIPSLSRNLCRAIFGGAGSAKPTPTRTRTINSDFVICR